MGTGKCIHIREKHMHIRAHISPGNLFNLRVKSLVPIPLTLWKIGVKRLGMIRG